MLSAIKAYNPLDTLIELSHNEMKRAYTRHQPTEEWRRVYTDACLLRTLAEILGTTQDGPLQESLSDACIARLDAAIIIAGPCGEGRLELTHEAITRIQSHTSWTRRSVVMPTFGKENGLPRNVTLPRSFIRPIPRIDSNSLPSLSAFASTYFMEPFILSGYALDWPAMQEHPWRSLEYLEKVAGPGRVVPVEVGSDYRADDWSQALMKWEAFLTALGTSRDELEKDQSQKPVLYLAQHNLFTQFPALREDIIVPDYVYAVPDAPKEYREYRPPANDEQLVINAWLGPAGTISPAHTVSVHLHATQFSMTQ